MYPRQPRGSAASVFSAGGFPDCSGPYGRYLTVANHDMPRFSVADLLLATFFVAVGVCGSVYTWHGTFNEFGFYTWHLSGAFIGAGLLILFKRPLHGAAIGCLVYFLVLLFVVIYAGDL